MTRLKAYNDFDNELDSPSYMLFETLDRHLCEGKIEYGKNWLLLFTLILQERHKLLLENQILVVQIIKEHGKGESETEKHMDKAS